MTKNYFLSMLVLGLAASFPFVLKYDNLWLQIVFTILSLTLMLYNLKLNKESVNKRILILSVAFYNVIFLSFLALVGVFLTNKQVDVVVGEKQNTNNG